MDIEIYHFKIGKFNCSAINDGYISGLPAKELLSSVPADQVQRYGMEAESYAIPCICLLVDTGQHRILLDTGGGPEYVAYPPPMLPELGRLMPGLQAAGIAAESIDTVVLSHMHIDHISGCADAFGKPAFPNACYMASQKAWQGFMRKDLDREAPSTAYARKQCSAVQNRIEFFEGESEIVPGMCAFPTPGHTAHHYSFEFTSEGERLVCPMDALGHPLHGEHPDWTTAKLLIPSRREVLRRAEGATRVHGFHFPFPGLGNFVPEGDHWRWEPIQDVL